jgi:hypothetical protein
MSRLEIISRERLQSCSNQEINLFESNSGIILPSDFKDFCRVFGTSSFGEFVGISCPPDVEFSREISDNLRQALERLRETDIRFESRAVDDILENALIFGADQTQDFFLWDLRTYSLEDDSYDIYFVTVNLPEAYLIGRSFFEFVTEYCLGERAFDVLPESLHPLKGDIQQTFTAEGLT